MSKSLIVYYSHSGNTRKIADLVKKKTGADVFFLQVSPAYPNSYNALLEVSRQQRNAGELPSLQYKINNIDDYDTIYVGTPNWFSTMSLPVLSFLKTYDLSGKTIALFITHGGGGIADSIHDLKLVCPNSTIVEPLSLYGSGGIGAPSQVEDWVKKVKQK